jgi:hypothetical protein
VADEEVFVVLRVFEADLASVVHVNIRGDALQIGSGALHIMLAPVQNLEDGHQITTIQITVAEP